MKIPNLGQNMFVPRQENILDGLFNMFGSIISGSIGADAADTQTVAQLQANYEQIAAQREESDKAFKRNSSIGQKAQLMAAGLSEQQAMQVIAGNAMTGEYQPAEIGNAMEGVDLSAAGRARADAAMNATAGFGSAVSELGRGLYDSIRDPEGGNLGAIQGTPLMNMISENLSLVDRKIVHTFADFENWVKGLPDDSEAGKVFKPMLESKEFKKVKRFSPAQLFCSASFGRMYTAAMDSNQAFEQRLHDIKVKISTEALQKAQKDLVEADIELRESQKNLTDEQKLKVEQDIKTAKQQEKLLVQQTLGEKYDALLKQFNYERFQDNAFLWSDYDKRMLLAQTERFVNDYDALSSETTKRLFIEEMQSSLQGSIYLNLLHAMQDKSLLSRLEQDPSFNWIVTAYSELNRVGLNPRVLGVDVGGIIGSINTGINRDYTTSEAHDNPVTIEHF